MRHVVEEHLETISDLSDKIEQCSDTEKTAQEKRAVLQEQKAQWESSLERNDPKREIRDAISSQRQMEAMGIFT